MIETGSVTAEKNIAHAQAKMDIGGQGPLGPIAESSDGIAERRVTRGVTSQDFPEVGHGRGDRKADKPE